jgi:hypothetical protein
MLKIEIPSGEVPRLFDIFLVHESLRLAHPPLVLLPLPTPAVFAAKLGSLFSIQPIHRDAPGQKTVTAISRKLPTLGQLKIKAFTLIVIENLGVVRLRGSRG